MNGKPKTKTEPREVIEKGPQPEPIIVNSVDEFREVFGAAAADEIDLAEVIDREGPIQVGSNPGIAIRIERRGRSTCDVVVVDRATDNELERYPAIRVEPRSWVGRALEKIRLWFRRVFRGDVEPGVIVSEEIAQFECVDFDAKIDAGSVQNVGSVTLTDGESEGNDG